MFEDIVINDRQLKTKKADEAVKRQLFFPSDDN